MSAKLEDSIDWIQLHFPHQEQYIAAPCPHDIKGAVKCFVPDVPVTYSMYVKANVEDILQDIRSGKETPCYAMFRGEYAEISAEGLTASEAVGYMVDAGEAGEWDDSMHEWLYAVEDKGVSKIIDAIIAEAKAESAAEMTRKSVAEREKDHATLKQLKKKYPEWF